jgi:hypothetical protein
MINMLTGKLFLTACCILAVTGGSESGYTKLWGRTESIPCPRVFNANNTIKGSNTTNSFFISRRLRGKQRGQIINHGSALEKFISLKIKADSTEILKKWQFRELSGGGK